MGKFSGIKEAKVSQGGVYFLAGLYVVDIRKCMMITSRKKKDLFIVECKIVESNNDKRPPGFSCSWCVNMEQDAALGNIKGFVSAAYQVGPEEVDEETCELVVDDSNPMADTLINLEVVDITTREGNPFSLHKWTPYEG